ncbi:MAG: hypothetical protein CVU39_13485 [Chloroflexi bacterium HGW-Chloroflexi-10]|nr:MAG: hypothetical protein CVU39_13485 [Chloroflexi bacterium HGW-Chloroflexi-10]
MSQNWKWVTIILMIIAIGVLTSAILFNWSNWELIPGTDFFQDPDQKTAEHMENSEIPNFLSIPAGLVTGYLGSVILMYLLPQRLRVIAERFSRSPKNFYHLVLVGFLGLLLFSAIGAGSVLTLGTFPFLFLVLLIEFLGTWLGYTALSYRLGIFFQMKTGWFTGSPLIALGFGHIIFYALLQIPLFGIVLMILLVSLGLGGMLATRFGSDQPWSLSVLKEGFE